MLGIEKVRGAPAKVWLEMRTRFPPLAPGQARVIPPGEFVTVIFAPAVMLAATGAPPLDPMRSSPSLRGPRKEKAEAPFARGRVLRAGEDTPVPPFAAETGPMREAVSVLVRASPATSIVVPSPCTKMIPPTSGPTEPPLLPSRKETVPPPEPVLEIVRVFVPGLPATVIATPSPTMLRLPERSGPTVPPVFPSAVRTPKDDGTEMVTVFVPGSPVVVIVVPSPTKLTTPPGLALTVPPELGVRCRIPLPPDAEPATSRVPKKYVL